MVRFVPLQICTQHRMKKEKSTTNLTFVQWTKRERDKETKNSSEQLQRARPTKVFHVALLPSVREDLLPLQHKQKKDARFMSSYLVSRPNPFLAICFSSSILSEYLHGDGQLCICHIQPRSVRVRGLHANWIGVGIMPSVPKVDNYPARGQDGLDHLYRGAADRSQGRKITRRNLAKCMFTVH